MSSEYKVGELVLPDTYMLWDYPESIDNKPGVIIDVGTDFVMGEDLDEDGYPTEELAYLYTVRWDDEDFEADFYEWDIEGAVPHPQRIKNKDVAKIVLSNNRGW